jgi:hypothetical protein
MIEHQSSFAAAVLLLTLLMTIAHTSPPSHPHNPMKRMWKVGVAKHARNQWRALMQRYGMSKVYSHAAAEKDMQRPRAEC